MDKIFIIGGFGYENVGDEGQLGSNLKQISQIYPDVDIVVASPNVGYTKASYPSITVIEALRSCFFKQKVSRVFQIVHRNRKSFLKFIGNEVYKAIFICKSILLLFQVHFLKLVGASRFINRSTYDFLVTLKGCDVLFFSGGGYMTEPTLSRLWDGFLHIYIAKIFGIKVYMSGQTIGPIESPFNRLLAKKLFSGVEFLATRDPDASIKLLHSLSLDSENFGVTCDDATFCEADDSSPTANNYVAYQCHYWGTNENESKKIVLNKNIQIITGLINKGYKVILISMAPSDEETIRDIVREYHNESLIVARFVYDFNYIVSLFMNARITVTMKHHPIVFSLGNATPVISLNFSEYYHHKNSGALKLFGLGKYAFDFNIAISVVFDAVEEIESTYDEISVHLSKRGKELYEVREAFLMGIGG